MTIDFKKRLLQNKGNATTQSTGEGIYSKFQKRSTDTLEKIYEDRDKRLNPKFSGRRIFNEEVMQEFGILEYLPALGDNFFEILPISLQPTIPYFKQAPVHYGVGFNRDSFICTSRWEGPIEKRGACHRCTVQSQVYQILPQGKKPEGKLRDYCKMLYPTDRALYLLFSRTNELLKQEEPDLNLYIWASPITKIHKPIQEKVRNKISRDQFDVSDVTPNGEGKTVGFTMEKNKGDFANYTSLELIPRDKPIPPALLTKLLNLLETAESMGYSNALDMLIYFPDQSEIKESMKTEAIQFINGELVEMDANGNAEESEQAGTGEPNTGTSLRDKLKAQTKEEPANEKMTEDQIAEYLIQFQSELQGMTMFKFKLWLKQNGYQSLSSEPQEGAINIIIDELYNKMVEENQ